MPPQVADLESARSLLGLEGEGPTSWILSAIALRAEASSGGDSAPSPMLGMIVAVCIENLLRASLALIAGRPLRESGALVPLFRSHRLTKFAAELEVLLGISLDKEVLAKLEDFLALRYRDPTKILGSAATVPLNEVDVAKAWALFDLLYELLMRRGWRTLQDGSRVPG